MSSAEHAEYKAVLLVSGFTVDQKGGITRLIVSKNFTEVELKAELLADNYSLLNQKLGVTGLQRNFVLRKAKETERQDKDLWDKRITIDD